MPEKFIITDNSKVGFGKYKGQPHSALNADVNYKKWLLAQKDFKFNDTRNYIIKNTPSDELSTDTPSDELSTDTDVLEE